MTVPNPYSATWSAANEAYHYARAIEKHGKNAVALKLTAHYQKTENLDFPDALGATARTMKVMNDLISGGETFKDLRGEMDNEARNSVTRPVGNAIPKKA